MIIGGKRRWGKRNDSILPAWWDNQIDPGRQYGHPITWGGLLAPLLLVLAFVAWPYVAAILVVVGIAAYVWWYVGEVRDKRTFERRYRWRQAHPEVTDAMVRTHAPWMTGDPGW